MRVVLDARLRIGIASRLIQTAREWPVLIFTSETQIKSAATTQLRDAGAQVLPAGDSAVDLKIVMEELHRRGVTHLMVEPGPTVARGFFEAGLADRLWVFHSPKKVDEATAPGAAKIPADFLRVGELESGEDRLDEYLNRDGPAFFAAEQSADFVLSSESVRQ